MRKFLLAMFVVIFSTSPSLTLAQTDIPEDKEEQISELTPEEEAEFLPILPEQQTIPNTTTCFDDYRFGSVQTDISPSVLSTVPGVPLTFSGKIKNDNPYPIVDGSVYVKIFKKQKTHSNTDLNTKQNGHELVDQFFVKENISVKAKDNTSILFVWNIPRNAESGDYQAATYFVTAKRFNLSGLSFTDDVTGNKVDFSIKSDVTNPPAHFNKNTVTLNQKPHKFAIFPLHFPREESVTAEAELINSSKVDKTIQLNWKLYKWDGLREENKKDEKTETITLKGSETKKLSYTVSKDTGSVAYLIAEARDGASKSILDIRFVREGIEETRLNFPSITSYPLTQGQENSLFSCVHSTNFPIVKDNTITLTLKTLSGETIHKYTYQGDISGEMMGVKEAFTPKETMKNFTLTATLKNKGNTIEEVTQTYLCDKLGDNCPKETITSSSQPSQFLDFGEKDMWLKLVLFLVGAILLFFIIRRMVMKRSMMSFLLGFLLVSSLMFGLGGVEKVEGKSIQANAQVNGTLYYIWAYEYPDSNIAENGHHRNVPGVSNPHITIDYYASAYDSVGNVLADGTNVSVGSQIKFQFKPHQNIDIFWFGSGYYADSPYGRWITNAQPPTLPLGRIQLTWWPRDWRERHTCDQYDYVFTEKNMWNGGKYGDYITPWDIPIYIPLSVNPPIKQSIAAPNLNCGTGIPDVNGYVVCSVTGTGPINANLMFNGTYARFYHRQYDPRIYRGDIGIAGASPDCYGSNVPMNPNWSNFLQPNADFTIPIPAKTINFSFNAVPANGVPSAPVVTGHNGIPDGIDHGTLSTPYNFTASDSVDPEGDQIRYGFDWDNNGSVDQWMPALGYIVSGASQTVPYSWLSTGPHTFQVLAQDNKNGNSPWKSHTINIAGSPVVDLKINNSDGPISLTQGQMRNFTWTTTDAVSCTASSSDVWSGSKAIPSGSESLAANNTSNNVLTCTGPGGTSSDSVQVNVSCTPTDWVYGQCQCPQEIRTRSNGCQTETNIECDAAGKNSCRDFNFREVAP